MLNLISPPPLSLYIHIPWCVQKCPYCDFNSHAIKSELPEAQYLQALLNDLEQDLPRIWGRRVQSVFIGGGTPSVLSPEFYERLFSALRALLAVNVNAEITLEANPGTIDYERFKGFREAGINRLSIGVQSFNDRHLQSLGRIHSANQAIKAFEVARNAGFTNINLDLMFGLPSQSVEEGLRDIEQALMLNPEHFSYYQLTIEPNTFFHAKPPSLPDDDLIYEMQQEAQQRIAGRGFEQYEISAYAKPGKRCAHNCNYWEFGDYLGIGAGAHSKLTDVAQQKIIRLVKEKHPREYLSKAAQSGVIISEHVLNRHDLAIEFMLNALRLTEGFPAVLFSERTRLPITVVEAPLRQAEQQGLIEWGLHTVRPTDKGKLFLNNLLELFLQRAKNKKLRPELPDPLFQHSQ
ncbi:MAG: radical SAM family heme chaperone HemW [Gammaproteobacteria bacterium]|nr:radical SAM family heme chaperone HemW [Gammaproteobacteria bacterium]